MLAWRWAQARDLHLQELVKQNFDPDKFAGVFMRGGGGPPRWLDGLLQDRCGTLRSCGASQLREFSCSGC